MHKALARSDRPQRSHPSAMGRPRLFDHALGAYLGLAIGDALGATVEFMTPGEIAHRHGVHKEIIGGGWLNLKSGQVTDDTTMSLALGEAVLQGHRSGRPFDAGMMADAFAKWLKGKPVDCGNTCRRGIVRYMADGSLEGPFNEGDAGNGALMRNLPVALATLGHPAQLRRASMQQARITHHHPLSDAATLAFGDMLHALLGQAEPRQAMALCHDIASALVEKHAVFCYQPYRGLATGYVVDTVQTVLHHFFSSSDFETAVLGAVNQGGDADTTGALVGMLAGALCGAQALPKRWLAKLDRSVKMAITEQTSALLAVALAP